ncbi:MAG: hypothetical protein J5794_05855 [Lachnospiraceae bacterium]|nr:hypothetical protein [Lachnospiraceae bacterium]
MKAFRKILALACVALSLTTAVLSGCGMADSNKTTYLSAKKNPVDVAELKQTLSTAKAGDHVYFGSWEQHRWMDGDELISWTVIRQEVGKALLLADYVIERKAYEEQEFSSVWPTSTIRSWLNGEFVEKAFTADEQSLLLTTVNQTIFYQEKTQWVAESEDRVFLLSMEECAHYVLKQGTVRYGIPCYNVFQTGVYKADIRGVEGVRKTVGWWLRDSGTGVISASTVNAGDGIYNTYGVEMSTLYGVRPAVWVVYDADLLADYEAGKAEPEPDPELEERIRNAKAGDLITFGTYDLDPSSKNGYEDLQWYVLEAEEDRILVIAATAYLSAQMVFSDEYTDCSWQSAELRQALNDQDFLKTLFTPQEIAKISLSTVASLYSKDSGTAPLGGSTVVGPDGYLYVLTEDRLFLPSEAELRTYFSQGFGILNTEYWLRDRSETAAAMNYAAPDGTIKSKDAGEAVGLRFMMWLSR